MLRLVIEQIARCTKRRACVCFASIMENHRNFRPKNASRYINASEVGTFLFCRRAWAFQHEGAPSTREPERQAGTNYHVQHGERVVAAERTGGFSRALLVIALMLLVLSLLAAFW